MSSSSASVSTSGTIGNIVVIDTGLSSSWNTGNLVYQYDFADNDGSAMVSTANTHGALVTSDIISQVPDAGIIALKVMPDDGGGADMSTIEKALRWVVANADAYHVTAVNLSLGGGTETAATTSSISDELAALSAKNVITVAAAGNSGDGGATQTVSTFAADPNEVCVSASTGDGALPDWSQRGPTLTDICADGTGITLTDKSGQSYSVNGSSFAAPTVTAAVALAQREATTVLGHSLTEAQFVDLARGTGTAVGTTGYIELNTKALLAAIDHMGATASTGTESGDGSAGSTTPAITGTTITVNASGTAAGGVNAHFKLLVDGHQVGAATVGATAKDFTFTTDLTADQGHTIAVQYDNDGVVKGQDRNLLVNTVTINGHTVAATASNVTYDKGALDGKDVVKGQTGMWWNGALVVKADPTDFSSAAKVASLSLDADGQQDVYQHLVTRPAGVRTSHGHDIAATVSDHGAADVDVYAQHAADHSANHHVEHMDWLHHAA